MYCSCAVANTSTALGSLSWMTRAQSMPDMPGISTSISTTSGVNFSYSASSSSPLCASPTSW